MTESRLEYLYHHVFLPPRLPQRNDIQNGQGDRAMLDGLLESTAGFRAADELARYKHWSTIYNSLRTFGMLHSNSKSLSKTSLKSALRGVEEGDLLILHIALQNSGLIIHKRPAGYIFEAFEASPTAADVLAAEGALEWDFPSRAAVIPSTAFESDSFQNSLAEFLEKASLESVKQYAATTLKAGSEAYESRDTTFPAIIGQLLMSILEAVGRKHTATLTRKRVHDEVCWNDGAENPWRRSATWLILRVGIQRSLCSLLGPEGIVHYKFFMCFFMSNLCSKFCAEQSFSADRLAFARAKIASRLAKLEAQSGSEKIEVSELISSSLLRHDQFFTTTLRLAGKCLEDQGHRLRLRDTRKMYKLPWRADPESTVLSLYHSRKILNRIMTEVVYGHSCADVQLPQRHSRFMRFSTWINEKPQGRISTTDYYCLADMETGIANDVERARNPELVSKPDRTIEDLRRMLRSYQARALRAYKENAELSSLMILTLMELWVAIDSVAVRSYPLLLSYDPGFPGDLLFPLKATSLSDMRRIQLIEEYLEKRRANSVHPISAILGDPSKTSFAVQFYDQSEAMQKLSSDIWIANEAAKSRKEQELAQQNAEYEALTREASMTACLFIEDEYNPLKRQHDDRGCRKHFLERSAARMRIQIYEDMLPADEINAKAVVFELLLPQGFAAWRDSTWQLLTLARGESIPDKMPTLLLGDYSGLKKFVNSALRGGSITLASRTKSFHQTHYAKVPFPAQLDQVCLPHGLKYGMYDNEHGLWTSRHLEKPDFAEVCSPDVPTGSAWALLKRYLHPTFENVYPSANEIVANQTRCPNNLTVAEYTSFQDLRVGTRIQWLKLLRELASSNINFGTIEVTTLITELALGAGPHEHGDTLRAAHWVFRDLSFCRALAAQIRKRLQAIATNWRESQTIESMLILLQRLWSLSTITDSVNEAQELIFYVREITHAWIRLLRREICSALDVETAQKRSRESLHAALLCRRTFMIELTRSDAGFEHEAFTCFLECAFTIRDNLSLSEPGYIRKMPAVLRRLYVSDLKLLHKLEAQVRWSIEHLQSAIDKAVNSVWMGAEGPFSRQFSTWTILPSPQDGWVTATSIASENNPSQRIHFDMIEGTLYIDGQLLGRLPEEFSKQDFFQQFFGNRIFLTYPSYLRGMSYMLASPYEEHEIHFGFRDGSQFMRVRHRSAMNATLEFLPSSVFLDSQGREAPDLPLPLIHNCVHWLDLQTRTVQIRPRASMWRSKMSDWKIDLASSQAIRRNSLLVDPRSSVFARVASLIEPFEQRSKMTVFQPLKSNVTVDLPGLELSFRVNSDGLLESRQLRAFVDSDQDAGTLYGLKSKLVLCDKVIPENRSILVAMGPTEIERQESHLRISISHTGFYARFNINKLLGRLECAAEPRLIYFKAYCHAITASIHPDPLTGRTGTEEALRCLEAASAQPWAPLDQESYRILFSIADLTPARIYYPEKVRALQKVLWSADVLSASQDDNFRPIVEDILRQCAALHQFHLDSGDVPVYERQGDAHLLRRAASRNQLYKPVQRRAIAPPVRDRHYEARDSMDSPECRDAKEIALLVWQWSHNIRVSPDITARLQEWPLIQGYIYTFEAHLLSSLINFEPAANWGSLFRFCQQIHNSCDKPRLMFMFATMAFGAQFDLLLLRSLVAISIMDDSTEIPLPQCAEFIHFRRNHVPNVEHIAQYIRPYRVPYPEDERALLSITMHSKQRRKLELAQLKFEEASEEHCNTLAKHLLSQWPSRVLSIVDLPNLPLLHSDEAFESFRPEWERLTDNFQLSNQLVSVQKLLDRCQNSIQSQESVRVEGTQAWHRSWKAITTRPCMHDLVYQPLRSLISINDSPNVNANPDRVQQSMKPHAADRGFLKTADRTLASASLPTLPQMPRQGSSKVPTIDSELQEIISRFSTDEDPVRAAYGQDLSASLSALRQRPQVAFSHTVRTDPLIDVSMLNMSISSAQDELQNIFKSIHDQVTKERKWHWIGGLLPDITPLTLLGSLEDSAGTKGSSSSVRAHILSYARAIVNLQHLLRIRDAYRRQDAIQLTSESSNIAHVGWQIEDHIEWLLLEIDFNLIIREDQLQVARAMIASPLTTSNFVLQMNMGQGKSSVIIPMVAAALAKDNNLVRVVVPRSLLLQAAQLLTSRLGGLINRRIKHVPFSRKSPTDIESIKAYHKMHLEVSRRRDILLALPEHLLSFQLSGLQELSNGHTSESTYMIKLQAWFSRKARDILDECDHMLAVKTQLIYPSGAQSPVDGHPNRWKTVQVLLRLAKTHVKQLLHDFGRRLEVIERSPGAFPTVYFLDQHIKDVFIERLTISVLRGDGGLIPVQECSTVDLALANDFLRHAQFAKSNASKIAQLLKDRKDIRQQLLLLRGLLVHKILLMGLSKRWNVQYGIHPLRDPIAVPFRSKGIPSDQAEFGHPDVSILLTCLSFYNSGLTLSQFRQTLGLLLKSDEPVREFESWISEIERFPESLSSWNAINIDDETQCSALWNHLRLQMMVINFFLNHFVFPRHAKTFDRKLVSSGWDIATPLSGTKITVEKNMKENSQLGTTAKRAIGGMPTALTVGFSGTNDNKTLLPLNVVQNDLHGLSHTNAEVLTYLLQSRNRRYIPASNSRGKRLSERAFLHKLKDCNIRMLLDAGAQILELDNISLAKAWLEIDTEAEAAVFFGEDERARVVYRDGKVQPLAASPFNDNLGPCVVYLDEAHTRGVDLKMPAYATAALTLGVNQTKDHTVQAAMRLRQLAISQSVMFFAPPEVHQSILNIRKSNQKGPIDSYDVIVWLLEQTCCSIEQLQPLYVSQGLEYCRRRLAAQKYEEAAYRVDNSKAYLGILEQPERYSLEELYAPDRKIKASPIESDGSLEIAKYVRRLNVLKKDIRNTGDTVQALAHQEVEQEREVAIEVETVREVKKPRHALPCSQPRLHTDVRSFAETGRLAAGSHEYIQAFVALRQTAIGRRLGISDSATCSGLFITQDFSRTVIPDPSGLPRDEYSRPVHWVLWSMVSATALVITDYEADALLPILRGVSRPIVHLISYAAPVTKSMVIFDHLNFFSIPRLPTEWRAPTWLVRDIGIFAARTYFDFDDQYSAICGLLGLPVPSYRSEDLDREMPFASDENSPSEPFSPSPLLFMQEWIAVRRKGQDFSQTMMGDVCRGRRLDRPEDRVMDDVVEVEDEVIAEPDDPGDEKIE